MAGGVSMIIVYLSLVVIAVALIYLIVSAIHTLKGIREETVHMAKKIEKVREETEKAKKKQESAVHHFQDLEKATKESLDQLKYTADQGAALVATVKHSGQEIKKAIPFPFLRSKRLG
ncbi:hypothetical protein PU629_17840 [Pullulanibacillus sp. KACC 23026]|uniref:hypothetical protein n=1 Tax=Pullulanibacillus sp. KACC 23026 TaxID=3028315 RepID=UPI0023B174D1|nr:hypothetical protein [Pullulanibacillus sp. KACC 23026]WEG11968.1 hypothetical protein PU629_17840 [Pullulanibacillus sp. KACC 23026]